ncbi:hypothetical protein DFH09DRAFT_1366812, partial [Mycena vulgaris]
CSSPTSSSPSSLPVSSWCPASLLDRRRSRRSPSGRITVTPTSSSRACLPRSPFATPTISTSAPSSLNKIALRSALASRERLRLSAPRS